MAQRLAAKAAAMINIMEEALSNISFEVGGLDESRKSTLVGEIYPSHRFRGLLRCFVRWLVPL